MKTAIDSAKAKFMGLFVTSLVMCAVVTAAFWGPLPRVSENGDDSALPQRGSSESASTFSGTVMPDDSTGAAGAQPDATQAAAAERSLTASFDSLHRGAAARGSEQLTATLALFREAIRDPKSMALVNDALHNRTKPGADARETDRLKDSILVKEGQIVSLQNEIRNLQKSAGPAQQDVAKLKKSLDDKNSQIAGLQAQLNSRPRTGGTDQQALAKMKEDLSAKEAQITKLNAQLKGRTGAAGSGNSAEENKKLADENNFLKWAVRSEVNSNHNLTNLNATLKQANANLQNQLNELKKK